MTITERFTSQAPRILGITRIITGALFTCIGAQKILGAFGGMPAEAMTPLVRTAGLIELIGGALITIGLFSRSAAFLCSGLMAVAYFKGHAPEGFWPILNGGQPAILFCFIFLYLAAQGPGAWALDNLRRRSK